MSKKKNGNSISKLSSLNKIYLDFEYNENIQLHFYVIVLAIPLYLCKYVCEKQLSFLMFGNKLLSDDRFQ